MLHDEAMAGDLSFSSGLHDSLVVLGAAGVVIPAFARLRINPVIGFILVGILVGPFGLGALVDDFSWLAPVTIGRPEAIEPYGEMGIILLLFSIGLHLSVRRLRAMRRMVFGLGAAELLLTAAILGGILLAIDWPVRSAAWLALALAMSSTALVLPISGTNSPVGRAALAMLLFEDLALVPALFLIGAGAGSGDAGLSSVLVTGGLVLLAIMLVGRFLLPHLFAQAARAKQPELFFAISLLVVILAAAATQYAGLSPILGALVAGVMIAETDYGREVELVVSPLKGLALGVFLISIGMRLDLSAILARAPEIFGALALVVSVKAIVTGAMLRVAGARSGVAAETGLLMASPSETSLILLGAAGAAGILRAETVAFWSAVTALGLTITPLLASIGKRAGRRVDGKLETVGVGESSGRTIILGFGRVGRLIADMLVTHDRPYLAIESHSDGVREAKQAGYDVRFGDVARRDLLERLDLAHAAAVVLTMDDPVLTTRLTQQLRAAYPDLPLIARARDSVHAAALYRAGVTDAVPEALEASLQLSEAVLVDVGVAMGPVIVSIHERRSQLRAEIMRDGELEVEPTLGRRRIGAAPAGTQRPADA